MTYTFKLARRIARFRALAVAALFLSFAGCDSSRSLDPGDDSQPEAGNELPADNSAPAAVTFAGGIPMGTFALPTEKYGSLYNGGHANIWPEALASSLASIKAQGGRVALMMAGSEQYYKDSQGHFSFTKWKARVDRFRQVNLNSYVTDGTIIGHYLIDEPHDPRNWNGQPIPASTLEEMAKYSKSIWPGMTTIVREGPSYLLSNHNYLDVAWSQYTYPWGDPGEFVRKNVSIAQSKGLQLIVGLNVLKGGPNRTQMTPTQVRTWGSALLSSTYPCAFISWTYDSRYLSNSGIIDAMKHLRSLAQNRATKTCRGSTSAPPPPPPDDDPPPPPPDDDPPPPPTTTVNALPFGMSLAPIEEYSTRWTGTVYRADPSTLIARLDRAKATQMKIIVNLVAKSQAQNADGSFSLTKWKAQVDRFRSLSLGSYITGKTMYLHDLVEQPQCSSCWGGRAIPWTTVEEMARYSKSIWPSLPTVALAPPSRLAEATFRWTYLDAAWVLYNTRQGDLRVYLTAQIDKAKSEGLGLVAGLNVMHGAGLESAPMTANQIKSLGTIMAKNASVCAMVAWRHDESYLNQTGIRAAVDSVAKVAKTRAPGPCVVS